MHEKYRVMGNWEKLLRLLAISMLLEPNMFMHAGLIYNAMAAIIALILWPPTNAQDKQRAKRLAAAK
jgi:hypothetical protein